jgi:hypothetical protein
MMRIHIDKSNSSLDKLTVSETVNIDTLNRVLESDICTSAGDEVRIKLMAYRKRIRKGIVDVQYKKGKCGFGRIYPSCSLSNMKRIIRHTLTQDTYIDIDIVNCGPQIVNQLCEASGLRNIFLTEYIKNREDILKSVMTTYDVTRDDTKDLFIGLLYGGSFNGWLTKVGRYGEPTTFISNLSYELKNIIEQFVVSNNSVSKVVKLAEKENSASSVMSLVIQEYECRILEVMYKALNSPKNVMFGNDGIMILNSHPYDLVNIKRQVTEQTGFNMEFKVKAMTEGIKEIPLAENSFAYMQQEFEKTHLKIIDRAMYIKERGQKIIEMSKHTLVEAYEHLTCMDGLKEVSFIQKWIHEPTIRHKDEIDCYPDNSKCPDNVYNTWKPFAMEYITEYEPQDISIILEHINILCGRDPAVYEYFIKWIGQMIQYPDVKTICPCLISEEGAGKGTLLIMITKMLGESKYFETTTPSNSIWGTYTAKKFSDGFFVHLSELSKKDSGNVVERINGLITDVNLDVNIKMVPQFSIKSYHRFIIATNKNDPIKTHKGDRRHLIIRSSDELVGNKQYFNDMYKLLDDVNVIKSCFEYFKALPDLDKFHMIPMPKTEHQEALKELAVSVPEQYLEHLVRSNLTSSVVSKSCGELYTDFNTWALANGHRYETTSLKLGVQFKLLRINGIETVKGRTGNSKQFNIQILKEHFKIE